MTNSFRGELDFDLQNRTYTLCLPFKELIHLEDQLQKGLFEIAKVFADGKAGLREVTCVLWCGLRGGGEMSLSFDELGELLTQSGFAKHLPIAMTLLSRALGGYSHEKE